MKVEILKDFGRQTKGSVINFPDSQYDKCLKLKLVKESNKKLTSDTSKEPTDEEIQLFDTRKAELDKYPEFNHKLNVGTDEDKYNKIVENLNKWKVKNGKE